MRIALYGLICSVVMLGGCQSSPKTFNFKGFWSIVEKDQFLLDLRDWQSQYKPYVNALYTPAGVNVLRDQVPDHLHHHGLMMALNVNGINFWEETAGSGYQVTEITESKTFYPLFGGRNGLVSRIHWMNAAKDTEILTEQRWIDARLVPKYEASLTTWTSVCSVPAGQTSVRVAGQHYYGLGMRFVQSMDNNGEFVYAGGEPGPIFRGDERLTEGAWCAYRSAVEGKLVTVAMFDDPGNPRPATWFTMKEHFAYLSATMRLHETPLEVTADKPMTLRYGVALWDGHRSNQEIETLYQLWLKAIKK